MKEKEKNKTIWIINPYCSVQNETSRQACLARCLMDCGYNVLIICDGTANASEVSDTNKQEISHVTVNNLNYLIVRANGASNIIKKKTIKRVVKMVEFQRCIIKNSDKLERPDIVISNFVGVFGNYFLKLKKKYGTKVIFDVLDLWPEAFVDLGYLKKDSLITKILYKFEHNGYKRCDSLFFSMEGGRDYIVEKGWDIAHGGGVDLNKIYYMNNGIDIEIINKDMEGMTYVDNDLDSDNFKVVYIGSISRPNNIDMLVDVAKLAKEKKMEDISFLIYGDGDQLPRLEQKVKEQGLNNIKFKGRLNKIYAVEVASRSNVTVLNFQNMPALRFGICNNKFFVYCAGGKPIISTVRPNYELVESCGCGINTNNDPESILAGIETFRNMDREEYEQYCKNALKIAEDFDYKKISKAMIEQIEYLLSER